MDLAAPKSSGSTNPSPAKTPLSEDVEMNTDDIFTQEGQPGVQNIEAVTSVWNTNALVVAYILIWLTYFIEGLLSGTQAALLPYVTSAFASHSLTPTVSVVSSVVGGCTNFTIAKILDVFGRPQGYLFCIILAVIGLVMMAACREVEAYAAAMVFYTVGNTGLLYCLSVFVADTSSLKNRGLMQAFAYSPNMTTCWLAGPISTAFLNGAGWPWAFGMFAILVPAVTLPLFGLMQWNYLKAKKQDIAPKRASKKNFGQSIVYYGREFDIVGLLLVTAGVALFLLPFNLWLLQPNGWASPLVICLLVFGVVLLVLFVLWEKFFAPVTFIPYSLLLDRTVIGACILSSVLFFSYFCWYSYFSSYLQVVNDLSLTNASYLINTYAVGSVVIGFAAGAWIHYTARYKPVALYFGLPMSILGCGLMIHFREPNGDVGYLIMCQVFIAFGAGVLIIADEIAILSAASHQYIAVSLATVGFFGNIGGAIGLSVTSAIWQNTFPKALLAYLPIEAQPDLLAIYGDLATQLSYPVGSPTRLAIQRAYGAAQRDLLIAATAVWVLGIAAVLLWRNVKVDKIHQTKGHVI